MGAFSILIQALMLNGTVQSNHRKREGIIMLNGFYTPYNVQNLTPSFLISYLNISSLDKHRIMLVIREKVSS